MRWLSVLAFACFLLTSGGPARAEENLTDAQVEARFRRADRNRDGRLDRTEIRNRRYFDRLDQNGDGSVTLEEAKTALVGQPDARKPQAPESAPTSSQPAAASDTRFVRTEIAGLTDVEAGTNGFALADLNHDGWLDYLAVQSKAGIDLRRGPRGRPIRGPDRLRVLLNQNGTRFVEHELSLGTGRMRYSDIGRSAQVPNLVDLNGDGHLDLWVSRHAPVTAGRVRRGADKLGNLILLSDGAWDQFRAVPGALGAHNDEAYNRQSAFGDVDIDGWLDLALGCDNIGDVMGGYPHSRLYLFQSRGDQFTKGRFRDIGGTEQVPDFGGWYHDPAKDKAGPDIQLVDLDNDGDLDLLQSFHVDIRDPRSSYSPAEYRQGMFCWKNLRVETGKTRFEKVTGNGLAVEARMTWSDKEKKLVPQGRAPGLPYVACFDADNDGFVDVLAIGPSDASWAPRADPVGGRFWKNLGAFRFRSATRDAGLEALNWTYRQWYAFHGFPIPSQLANWRPWRGDTYPSQPGLKKVHPLDQRPYWADIVVGDFDNDGWQDVVALDRRDGRTRREARAVLFRNKGDGTFEPQRQSQSGLDGKGISGEAADLNNDGRLDLVLAADPDNSGGWLVDGQRERYRDKVYLGADLEASRSNHWLRLRFRGATSAELLGARVMATAQQARFHRTLSSSHAYKSSGPLEAHFGLGAHPKVDLTVTLVGGRTVRFKDVVANRYLELDLARATADPVLLARKPEEEAKPKPSPGRGDGAQRPNVLVIFTDDQGYAEVGCYGLTDVPTPHIDSLAKAGTRFTDGYVSAPVCSPSRAGILTGRYQQRFGHELNPGNSHEAGLPLTERTMGDYFKEGGYVTGLVGKWHLGMTKELHPMSRGFDEFFGFLHGGHDYIPQNRRRLIRDPILRGRKPAPERVYLTDAFGREAVEFIQRHSAKPWMLYLSFNAVHTPLQATPEDMARFKHIEDPKRRTYAGMLHAMDRSIGLVLAELERQGLEEETLVFFLSDNGGPTRQTTSKNTPLRGFKGQVFEGGVRVPFIMRWPGRIPAGKVYRKPVTALDVIPTALAATRITPKKMPSLDGVDLLPYLNGAKSGEPHEALFWRYGEQQFAVRTGRYKLVRVRGQTGLFDLDTDVSEKRNLREDMPEVVERLRTLYDEWDEELVPPKWSRVPFRRR